MSLHKPCFIALVSMLICVGSESYVPEQRSKRKTVTKVVNVWGPTPGSLFYEFTKALPKVSRIEVSQIGAPADQSLEDTVVFGKQHLKISNSKSIVAEQAEKFANLWRRQKQGAGNACFAPAFLLRFYQGENLHFETILCFHCHNLMLSGDDEIWGFDAEGKEGTELFNAIKQILAPMG